MVTEVPAVKECYCYLLSRIGHPIGDPQIFDVKVRPVEGTITATLAQRIVEVARAQFVTLNSIWREAVDGTLVLW